MSDSLEGDGERGRERERDDTIFFRREKKENTTKKKSNTNCENRKEQEKNINEQ